MSRESGRLEYVAKLEVADILSRMDPEIARSLPEQIGKVG